MQDFFNTLKNKIRKENLKLSEENFSVILKYTIEIVDCSQLRGTQKKRMVIILLNKLINELNMEKNTKKTLLEILNSPTTSSAIDTAVYILHSKKNCCTII